MALPWVLVDRNVFFCNEDQEGSSSGKGKEDAAIGGSRRSLSQQEAMAAMKPLADIVAPPGISYLHMLRPRAMERLGFHGRVGDICSTHEGLVVLYTGSYRPGVGLFAGDGCYLLCDAWNNAVSTVPPLPDSAAVKGLGRTAVALRRGTGGDYCLAELVTTLDPGFPEAELRVWSRSSTMSTGGQWIKTPVRLPLPAHLCGSFRVDMAFPLSSSRICWVDLVSGVLVCDLSAPRGPEFSFIPLPMVFQQPHGHRFNLEAIRSVGCVRGAIKFVSLESDSDDRTSSEKITLKNWTLSPDFKAWKEGKSWCVGEIWASESFKKMELPHVVPTCPVLSMNEDGVIYAILNVFDQVDYVDDFGFATARKILEPKAHYVIEFDMLQNKVLKSTKSSLVSLSFLRPSLHASDLSTHFQGRRTDRYVLLRNNHTTQQNTII